MVVYCIICGGNHVPDVKTCKANPTGMEKQIKKLGARLWNRLSGIVQRRQPKPWIDEGTDI